MNDNIQLYLGDCLEIMPTLPDHSIDLICCDLPYAVTYCLWDSLIPLEPLWCQYKRLLKPDGTVVLTSTMKFAVQLINAAPKKWFRYDLVWNKVMPTGFLDANRKPMRVHENILVFAPKGHGKYRPEMSVGTPYRAKTKGGTTVYNGFDPTFHTDNPGTRYPTSILKFSNGVQKGKVHPTQKSLELMSYLVRTYSDPSDVVLDNAMGSGSTGRACILEKRVFIGIEKDPGYFEAAKQIINDTI